MAKVLLVELTARWLRVWFASGASAAQPVCLQENSFRVPLAITRAGRLWQLGWPAWKRHRQEPRQILYDFLPELYPRQVWYPGGKRLTARQLVQLIAEMLRPHGQQAGRTILLVPAYLQSEQAAFLVRELQAAGLPSPIALWQDLVWLVAGLVEGVPAGVLCLVDVDDWACVITSGQIQSGEVYVGQRLRLRELGRRVWLERVMLAASELAIRDFRRDPRRTPEADQCLYEQIEAHWAGLTQHRHTLNITTPDFHCRLTLTPELVQRSCLTLAQQSARAVANFLATLRQQAMPEVWLTARAGELPMFFRQVYEALGFSQVVRDLPEESYLTAALWLAENPALSEVCPHQLPVPDGDWSRLPRMQVKAGSP